MSATPPLQPTGSSRVWFLIPLLVGAWITLIVATAANSDLLKQNTAYPTYFRLFFSDPIHLKVWLASAAALLALFQIFSAAWIFNKLPFRRPSWIGFAHRWSGRVAFALTVPVAYHCIFLLGFQTTDTRVAVHSFAGIFFYGALAAKVIVVRSRRFPGWLLPLAGGIVFTLLIALWYLSALWFFRTINVSL